LFRLYYSVAERTYIKNIKFYVRSLEAFVATQFSEIFWCRQPCEDVKVLLMFRKIPPSPSSGTEIVPRTSADLHILMQLSGQENFIAILC
jgi:hypothetical protein